MATPSMELLVQQVAQLPRSERAALAQHLIESLDTSNESTTEVAEAWIAEAEARWIAIERGEAKTYSSEEVLAEAHQLLK